MSNIDKIHDSLVTSPFDARPPGAFLSAKDQFVIHDGVDYPDPEYLLAMGDVSTLPKGNLVALSAKWKSGKTFFCDVIAAALLGARCFGHIRTLRPGARVQFFDTEQAVSDTARVRRTILSLAGEQRARDIEVYCLRNADIDNLDPDAAAAVTRYDFIEQAVMHFKPDLAIVDGIADLIYNYNDVIESQQVVNNLAALANKANCCILTVMHQNKGARDTSMKGHLGTLLYQKCSDVFSIEKTPAAFFIVSHTVSRHRTADDYVFRIDPDGRPADAAACWQAAQAERRQTLAGRQAQHAAGIVNDAFNGDEMARHGLRRGEIVKRIVNSGTLKPAMAYRAVSRAVEQGILVSDNGTHYRPATVQE